MNVKIIDKTGKFIIYDKRNTLLITADMAQAGKLAELIQMYFSLEYWQRREVAEHGNERFARCFGIWIGWIGCQGSGRKQRIERA